MAVCSYCESKIVPVHRAGLCKTCYMTEWIRLLYGLAGDEPAAGANKVRRRPPAADRSDRTPGPLPPNERRGPRPIPAQPTDALPGTPRKIRVMAERARLGQQLWHPRDARMEGVLGGDFIDAMLDRLTHTPAAPRLALSTEEDKP